MVGIKHMKADPKTVITWILIIIVPIIGVTLLAGFLRLIDPDLIVEIVKNHFAATIGLPMAALLSAFIVVSLRHSDGPMKFEGLGFKFEGSSGQVVLWIFCFLSITAAIKLVWGIG